MPEVVRRFPQWAEQIGISDVEIICREIERFSRDYDFNDEEWFWKVLEARVADPSLLSALTEFQVFALSRKQAAESLRLQRFLDDKARGSRTVLVRLDAGERDDR